MRLPWEVPEVEYWIERMQLEKPFKSDASDEAQADQGDYCVGRKLLVRVLVGKALKLCQSPTRSKAVGRKLYDAIKWMLKPEWNEERREWRTNSLAAAARRVRLTENRLREELEILAFQIAHSLDGLTAELFEQFFKFNPFEFFEIPPRVVQESYSTAIRINKRQAGRAVAEVEREISERLASQRDHAA